MSSPDQVPEDLADLLSGDRLGHVSSLRPDGSIATHLMWIEWDGRNLLTSSPVGSRKGQNWRANPHASVSVVDGEDPWRYVIIRGRVTDIRPDEDLVLIDRLSLRYTGSPYFRRNSAREVFYITPDHIRASRGRRR
jgi:PPOX class probable F420-dependent enzyme